MREIILFLFTFILIYVIYKIFIMNKAKKRNSKKKPIEIKYLESKYHIDIKKIDYSKLLNITALLSSFDIALMVSVISRIENYLLGILLVLILIVPLIMVSYHFLGKYYVKRGMIKDE